MHFFCIVIKSCLQQDQDPDPYKNSLSGSGKICWILAQPFQHKMLGRENLYHEFHLRTAFFGDSFIASQAMVSELCII